MNYDNPAKTLGFEFLEFTTNDKTKLVSQFEQMGFKKVAQHKQHDVSIYQQNHIRFIINNTKNSRSEQFAKNHGASVSAMGFLVEDATFAYQHCLQNEAKAYFDELDQSIYQLDAIEGVGGTLIYFVDRKQDDANYAAQFDYIEMAPQALKGQGLTYIDHVTHNLRRGNMIDWADFYTRLFNFREVRFFDIEGRMTGLKSKAMVSPCGKIRIPLNESSDDQSQIEEFINDFNGEGIQHIALGTDDIYTSIRELRNGGLKFLDTPETYYEMIDKRLPKHGEDVEQLRQLRILIDGETRNEHRLLLQIFTENMLGPVFFEIIQRKGDEGFGEGNFRALFESIELDQIRRGVLTPEPEHA